MSNLRFFFRKRRYFKDSQKSYQEFLRQSFAYSNSSSLKNGTKKISEAEDAILPGDLVIQRNEQAIGHVSMILDVAESEKKEKNFLLGFSNILAQEFHVEKSIPEYGINGWFTKKRLGPVSEKMDISGGAGFLPF